MNGFCEVALAAGQEEGVRDTGNLQASEGSMSAFENATRFFHACESSEGWEACQQYVEPGSPLDHPHRPSRAALADEAMPQESETVIEVGNTGLLHIQCQMLLICIYNCPVFTGFLHSKVTR